MKKLPFLLLVLILLLTFVVRLYKFNNPVADWHSWRQADTSSVARNFIKYGFDLLHPRMNNISNVQSGLENPRGYFFAEFPVYNATQAELFVTFHHLTIEEWGRLLTDFSAVITVLFIYLLSKRHANETVALVAAGFYALLPYNIYYGRVILPDPSMVMSILGGIYFFDKAIEHGVNGKIFTIKSLGWYVPALFFTILALLLKPTAIFFTLPMVYLAWKKFGFKMFFRIELYLFLILSVMPLMWWRWWESHYPEGIPAFWWLFNQGNIRFTGAYFYWIFAERISRLILGYWGIALVVAGFLESKRKGFGFFLSFVLSSLMYVIIIARGNVQHDYYQILIIPSLVMFFALGVDTVLHIGEIQGYKFVSIGLICVVWVFVLAFGWYQVRDYFNINNPNLIVAGEAVNQWVPADAKVIAPLDGDSSFLYQTNRQGWASFEKPLPEMIAMGADYLVLVNPQPQDLNFAKTYKLVGSSSAYLLFNLRAKP